MLCSLIEDYEYTCDAVGVGGVKTFWFVELNNITSVTESSGGVITDIAVSEGKDFRSYQLVMETSGVKETLTGNVQTNTSFCIQTATLIINKQDVNIRDEITRLAKNKLVLIAKDNNNKHRLYGKENGLTLVNVDIDSGIAFGDRNGYVLTFKGLELKPALFVADEVISTLQFYVITDADKIYLADTDGLLIRY